VFTCFVENPNTRVGVAPTTITVRIIDPDKALIAAVTDAAAEADTGAGAANQQVGEYQCKFTITDGDDSRVSNGVSVVRCVTDPWAS